MWLEVKYLPTSLFSLKSSQATNSAGKTLISPSPYSVKMALLNAIMTYESLRLAEGIFVLIRDLDIQFALPKNIIVNNCFIKILKEPHSETKKKNPDLQFQSTIAFREYVYLDGEIRIAIKLTNPDNHRVLAQDDIEFLKKQFRHINYFGKKGCFFQYISSEIIEEANLPKGYSEKLGGGLSEGIIFPMDDVEKNPKVTFENMSNYDSAKAKRVQNIHLFPYRQVSANKNFTYLRRID